MHQEQAVTRVAHPLEAASTLANPELRSKKGPHPARRRFGSVSAKPNMGQGRRGSVSSMLSRSLPPSLNTLMLAAAAVKEDEDSANSPLLQSPSLIDTNSTLPSDFIDDAGSLTSEKRRRMRISKVFRRRKTEREATTARTAESVTASGAAADVDDVDRGLWADCVPLSAPAERIQRTVRPDNPVAMKGRDTNVRVPIPTQSPVQQKYVTKKLPRCCACGKVAESYLVSQGRKYHRECLRCMGCHDLIDPSTPFTFAKISDSSEEKRPLHTQCYLELFGKRCNVCTERIPVDENGKVKYMKHPFFTKEVMCLDHAGGVRRCTGCHRFEPSGPDGFADLNDGGRCVCFSCCRTLVVDNNDAKPLWDGVIRFFENTLQLPVWEGMREVPVLVVGQDALNEQSNQTAHSGSSQLMTRGLCLSEHSTQGSAFLEELGAGGNSSVGLVGQGGMHDSSISSSITAILCLTGLPKDLTASILAHEATHAWIKLHPNYNPELPIPPMVEEGCCQLLAFLFLCEGLGPASKESDGSGPSDEGLRQYFKFSIETDGDEIYGEGFRKASKVYAAVGLEVLLSHVVDHRDFPHV